MEYSLKSGGCTAVVDTMGGELVSWRDENGTEYVWTGDQAYWSGHAPVLFPIVGALQNSTVMIGGVSYQMPKHGFARKAEFILQELKDDQAVFVLRSSGETRRQYPFEFRLEIRHSITEQGFITEYTVTSKAEEPMYFCIGGHAGICCPLRDGEQFEDYELVFETEEMSPLRFTDDKGILHRESEADLCWDRKHLRLNYDYFLNDVLIFETVRSRTVGFMHKPSGKQVTFDFDGFSSLGIWTPPSKHAPFLCIEPWRGLPAYADETGAFEDKPGVVRLDSEKSKFHARYGLKVIPR